MILSIFFEDIIKLRVKRFDPEQTSHQIGYIHFLKYANGNVISHRNSRNSDEGNVTIFLQ